MRREPAGRLPRLRRAPAAPSASPGRLPQIVEPMLAVAGGDPFDSPAHVFEVLWDGVRAVAFVEGGRVRLQDGFGRDVTTRYPELGALAASASGGKGSGLAIDGVIVALDANGVPDIARLLRRAAVEDAAEAARLAAEVPVSFQAFDLLYRDGRAVMSLPLRRRKELLREVLRPGGAVGLPDHVANDGLAFFEAARLHGLEGIIAKEWDSRYVPGQRTRAWLKLKVYQKDEFVIGGFTYGGQWRGVRPPPKRRRPPFASLLLGLFDASGALQYAGEATGGFEAVSGDEAAVRALDQIVAPGCPFAREPSLGRLVSWCRPELAATVRFGGWTPEGTLRFPVFEALRPDVPTASCRLDWARE
ncbi:MAG: hypothetical protein Q7T33_11430 [Dehalococcoidia bacterium]|nr:hypothetical protein [Dehalococcoidia bacterium]